MGSRLVIEGLVCSILFPGKQKVLFSIYDVFMNILKLRACLSF